MALSFEKQGHIALVRLNRPEALNAIDPETRKELRDAWQAIKEDDQIWVGILTGSGEKAFCTGADLKKTFPGSESFAQELLTRGRYSATEGMEMAKPLIAAVNGYAMGGGLELALACDIRICSTTAQFGLSEVRVASIPGAGGTQRLPRALPHAVAMKMLLTGDRIGPEEALRWGLVTDVTAPAELLPLAFKIAERICENGPLAVRATKIAAMRGANMPLNEGVYLESLLWGSVRDTEDRIEGRKAFGEKRKPQYKGR